MNNENTLIQVCEVLSVDDPQGCDRIKVKLVPADSNRKSIKELPFVFPLLPKYFSSKPKVGEAVLVMNAVLQDGNSQRYYIGPLVPQLQRTDDNMFNGAALSFLGGSPRNMLPSVYKDQNAKGICPEDTDVAIIGRKNADILLKDNDIDIRCGARKKNIDNPSGLEFNNRDQAFIKMKYKDGEPGTTGDKSSINIVADNINILGAQSASPVLNIDNEELINDEEFNKLMEEGHKLPYGDLLVDFLKKFRSAFLHHTHPFSMLPPCIEKECMSVSTYDLDGMLSDSVRIS